MLSYLSNLIYQKPLTNETAGECAVEVISISGRNQQLNHCKMQTGAAVWGAGTDRAAPSGSIDQSNSIDLVFNP